MTSVLEDQLLGECHAILELRKKLARIAAAHCPVLITGETGTGKELVVQAIHARSERCAGPFIVINCAAIPGGLMESELFGHERGAFTGAVKSTPGKFLSADKGTIVLDEVGELPVHLQAKLLRVVETGEIERLGSAGSVRADTRVIATTNRDLRACVQSGTFRDDLFFRLSVINIALPPLRQRDGDITVLANSFLHYFNEEYHKNIKGFSIQAVQLLKSYHWPGNVRELKYAVERAVVLNQGGVVTREDLDIFEQKTGKLRAQSRRAELDVIKSTLATNHGNVSRTARELGFSRKGLIYILQNQGIDPEEFRIRRGMGSPQDQGMCR